MCIFCNNKLLAATDRLCRLAVRPSKEQQVARQLEIAFADKAGPEDALTIAKDAMRVVFGLKPKAAEKTARKQAGGKLPDRHDHEQNMFSILLNYLQLGLKSIFGFACVGSPGGDEHKWLAVALLRIDSVEGSCAAVLAATIQLYRHGDYGDLPLILQQESFISFCREASIPTCAGGGAEWRTANFTNWKRDNLMSLYKGEDDYGRNVAFSGCRLCWACAAPTLDGKRGGSRRMCGGCECAAYCSTQCQRADRTKGKGHHKVLCGVLREVHDETDDDMGGGSPDIFAASAYFKWKKRDDHWKPVMYGDSKLLDFIAALEKIDPGVSSS